MVDAFHFPLAGLGDGQALVDICREGPAGHSQFPGLAVEGVGGNSPAWPSLSCDPAGPSLSTQQANAACPGRLPRACQGGWWVAVPTVTSTLLSLRVSIPPQALALAQPKNDEQASLPTPADTALRGVMGHPRVGECFQEVLLRAVPCCSPAGRWGQGVLGFPEKEGPGWLPHP